MDRYTYRGKRLDNNEWVCGFYHAVTKGGWLDPAENDAVITEYTQLDNGEIILGPAHSIDLATLGQCTGWQDKNGKVIFEGDIISAYNGRISGPVIFDPRGLHFGVLVGPNETYQFSQNFLESKDVEIISTIHDGVAS